MKERSMVCEMSVGMSGVSAYVRRASLSLSEQTTDRNIKLLVARIE